MQRKSLIALMFVSGLLSADTVAMASDSHDTLAPNDKKFLQSVEENSQLPPELRAYFLLQMAERAILTQTASNLDETYKSTLSVSTPWWKARRSVIVPEFARRVAGVSGSLARENKLPMQVSAETKDASEVMINKALGLLSTGTEELCNLNFYSVASNMYRMLGDKENSEKCKKVLDDKIRTCESQGAKASPELCLASSTALDAMAYELIPLDFPDRFKQSLLDKIEYDEKDFVHCKKLKERSLSLIDHLGTTSQDRRKAHRDMVLWYLSLGKTEDANQEKQKLYELVGIHDERILFPQVGSCGHLVWWVTQLKEQPAFKCGMG